MPRKKEWNQSPEKTAARRLKQRKEAIAAYGDKCANCHDDFFEVLVIDHVNGGSDKHIRQTTGRGHDLYRYLIKNGFPEGFQALCHNCNNLKANRPHLLEVYGHGLSNTSDTNNHSRDGTNTVKHSSFGS